MPEQKKTSDGSFRWWEFYAVRYAMGTVVGAIVFYFLCKNTPHLKPLLFGTSAYEINSVRLSLLATYGLVFCYIASAPILVFHAGRFLLRYPVIRSLFILALSIMASIAIWWLRSGLSLSDHWFNLTAGFLFVWIMLLQYCVAILTLVHRKDLFENYKKLANKREDAKGEITDSYRHLREHGNSFFIVLLEILLGVVLVVVGQNSTPSTSFIDSRLQIYLVILVIWIVPAALVWLIGTQFEREFSGIDEQDAQKATRPLIDDADRTEISH